MENDLVTENANLQNKIDRLAATLRQFADQFNWQRDDRWTPMSVALQTDPPSEIAAKTLEACGL